MRCRRQAVVDWCIVLVLAVVWVESGLNGNVLGFAVVGVVLIALLYRMWRPVAAQAEPWPDPGAPARPQGARLAVPCLVLVLLTAMLVVPQFLLAGWVVLHSERSVNDRGQEVVGNHLVLGKCDLAWVRAEMESDGAVNLHSGLFSTAVASIHPLHSAETGLDDGGFRFDWELRFGWPFTVRRWGETQFIGPGGVQGWATTSFQ